MADEEANVMETSPDGETNLNTSTNFDQFESFDVKPRENRYN